MSSPAPRSPSPPRPALLAATLLALAAPGCRGCGDALSPVDGTFTVAPAALDFGAALEGTPVTRTLTVTAASRLAQTVEVSAAAPFSAPGPLRLSAGDQVLLEVVFAAGSGLATGLLHLGTLDGGVDVPLSGEGVTPLACVPSQPCRVSTYRLEARACVEAPAPEGGECDPGDRCLERGRCRAGACLGTARSCDDNNPCTDDACSSDLGCVNTAHRCPQPANPCQVATCSVTTGCGAGPAPDFITQCGPVDCTVFNVCVGGGCRSFPTPLGAPCGVQVACVQPGSCEDVAGSRTCVRPDAGDWLPDWAASVAARPSAEAPVLLSSGTALFFEACGFEPAVLEGDAGTPDAGGADAGPADAGAPWCGLVSYTGTGFLRFTAPFEDGRPRRLVHLAGRGALLAGPAGLAYHSTADGRPLEGLGLVPPPDGVAVLPGGEVLLLAPDAGLVRWPADGGPAWVLDTRASVLSLEAPGRAFLLEPGAGVLQRVALLADGGLALATVRLDGGAASLTVATGTAVVGAAVAVASDDAGLPVVVGLDPGPGTPVRGGVLQTPSAASIFALRCPTPTLACAAADAALWLTGVDLGTGARTAEVEVAPADPRSRLVLAALLDLQPPAVAVAAVTVVGFDGGARAGLQVFSGSDRLLVCPFPEASTDLLGAVVTDLALVVLARRPDGGVALESYGLGVAPVHRLGWAAPFGEAGTRRAR